LSWDRRHIATHNTSHIRIATHARIARFTYGTLVQPQSGDFNSY